MNNASTTACCYELRFQPLAPHGQDWVFPCDANGCVDLDGLSDRVRHEYLYARAVVGREVARPAVGVSAVPR